MSGVGTWDVGMGRVRGWIHGVIGCRGGLCQRVGSWGDGM